MSFLVSHQGFGDNAAATTTVWGPGSSPALVATTPGNTLILLYRSGNSSTGTFTACTDTGGNTWTLPDPPKGGLAGGITNTYLACAYVHNSVAPGTITLTHGSIGSRLVKLIEVAGLQNAAPDVATEDFTNAVATTDIRSAAGTSTVVGDFLVGWASYSSTGQYPTGANAGFALLAAPPATGGRLASAFKIGTAVGAEQALFTGISTGTRYGAGLLAFKSVSTGSFLFS